MWSREPTVITGRVGVYTAANGEVVSRQNLMLVVTEHWPATGSLRISSSGHVVLKHQLGVEEKLNDLPRQTLRCSIRVTCTENHINKSTVQQECTNSINSSINSLTCPTKETAIAFVHS